MTRIDDASQWRLTLRLGRDEVCYCLTPTDASADWQAGRITLPPSNGSWLQRIEDAIYADERASLVDDFASVDIIVDTPIISIVPTSLTAEPSRCRQLLKATAPQFDGDVATAPMGASPMTLLMGIEAGVLGFATRTWSNCHLHHPLSVLADAMVAPERKEMVAAMVTGNRLAVIAADGSLLHAANVFDFRDPDDAAYFILSVHKLTDFASDKGIIELSGDVDTRKAIEERLRRFVDFVMPTPPPPALAARGAEAMRYPLDLMLLSL